MTPRALFVTHTMHIDPVFRVGSHFLASAMAGQGIDTLTVSSATSAGTAVRAISDDRARARLRAARTSRRNFVAHSPSLQWHVPFSTLPPALVLPSPLRSIQGFSPTRTATLINRWIGHDTFIFVDAPLALPFLRKVVSDRVIYRPTDNYVALRGPGIADMETEILNRSIGIVATSAAILEQPHLATHAELPQMVLANGVEFNHFRLTQPASPQRVVYYGSLDDRFAWPLLHDLADLMPGTVFEVAGEPAPPLDDLRPNEQYIGPVPYEKLPDFLGTADALLMPLSDAAANTTRSPMKLYEAFASGLPVIVLGAKLHLQPSAAAGVRNCATPAEAAHALTCTHQFNRTELRRLARAEDWSAKAGELLDFADRCIGRSP